MLHINSKAKNRVTSVGRVGSVAASRCDSDTSSKLSPSLPLAVFPKFAREAVQFCVLESKSQPELSNEFLNS